MNQNLVKTGPYALYDAVFRNYNPVWGRWLSPDPAGVAAANPMNPQSWNRYAYALNNPAIFLDPMGLQSSGGSGCVDAYECPQDVPQCDIEGDPWGGSITCTGWVISITVYATPIPPPGIFDASLSEGFVIEGYPMGSGSGGSSGGGSTPSPQQVQKYNQCVSEAKSAEHSSLAVADVATGLGIGAAEGGAFIAYSAVAEGVFEAGTLLEAFDTVADSGPKFALGSAAKLIPYVGGLVMRTQAMDAYDRAVANCQTQTGVYLLTGD